jgi:hypothetical protein
MVRRGLYENLIAFAQFVIKQREKFAPAHVENCGVETSLLSRTVLPVACDFDFLAALIKHSTLDKSLVVVLHQAGRRVKPISSMIRQPGGRGGDS